MKKIIAIFTSIVLVTVLFAVGVSADTDQFHAENDGHTYVSAEGHTGLTDEEFYAKVSSWVPNENTEVEVLEETRAAASCGICGSAKSKQVKFVNTLQGVDHNTITQVWTDTVCTNCGNVLVTGAKTYE